jgi:hypothetical protein
VVGAAAAYTGMTMGGNCRGGASVVQWSMADDRVLSAYLFIGVKM